MRIGIDASNIRAGGGVTHLSELLRAAQPKRYGFDEVIVWSGSPTLRHIGEYPWLRKYYQPILDGPLPGRLYWQHVMRDKIVLREQCDALFLPGASYAGTFKPLVSMSQNLLPFEWSEIRRYGVSWMFFKMLLLRKTQIRSFKSSDGIIFLTRYARDIVAKTISKNKGLTAIVPHGVDHRFCLAPRVQKDIGTCSPRDPFRILYVSSIDMYKHQWNVAEAVAYLKGHNSPVRLNLIGSAYLPALRRLRQMLRRLDPTEEFIHYKGFVPYSKIINYYHQADLVVFASSCETFGMILTEAMAAGLPIACSNRGPMPEVLGDAGVYFDPEKPDQIAEAIRILIEDPALRAEKAEAAYERAKAFTWERCARETFDFIAKIARE